MPNVYERVVDGQVVERVQPTPGDYEDTRLGVAVLDGLNGWRLADVEPEVVTVPVPETTDAPTNPSPDAPSSPAPTDSAPAEGE